VKIQTDQENHWRYAMLITFAKVKP